MDKTMGLANNVLSNTINFNIYKEQYKFHPATAAIIAIIASKLDLPEVERKYQTVKVTERKRNKQDNELLAKLNTSLLPCQHHKWLAKRNIHDISQIYSLDYSKLTYQDMLDLYIYPADYIIDRFGTDPVIGPVFVDTRAGQLAGICIRNCTTNKDYAAVAKYTFSNYGWFLWGYDLYDEDDLIYLVEGVFDAIAMRVNGYKAIAFGSAYPTAFQLACLAHKFKKFAICMDNDFWGHYGAYMIYSCFRMFKPTIIIPKDKDASIAFEENRPIILEEVDHVFLRNLLCSEIIAYNKIIQSGNDLVRSLPYN